MKQYTVIGIGIGNRGRNYTSLMSECPDKFKVVAIAEPIKNKREEAMAKFGLKEDVCFNSWEDVLAKPKFADVVLISTLDHMHYEPAMKAIELGYNILLEKPLSQTPKECADICLAAEKKGVKVLVCHVLRYTPFYRKIKKLVMDGAIGDIVSVIGVEAVGNAHQTHSYVRGRWHSEKETTPMLLAKSCHDIDILQWIIDKPCRSVQSFGSLTHFTEENAPLGAPVRCVDGGCPVGDTCPYNCMKLYYDDKKNLWFRRTCAHHISKEYVPTDEEVLEALKTTDYGLCVYHAKNDVVDHQVVNMEFEGGITASFTMNAFNRGGRYIRIFGTKGELFANMEDTEITLYTFRDKKTEKIPSVGGDETIAAGHGGGDMGIVCELYDYLGDNYTGYSAADINISVKNHLICFAAEESRHNKTVENVDEYMKRFGMTND